MTPNVLVLDGYYMPFVGVREILIEDIDRVWRDYEIPSTVLHSVRAFKRISARDFLRRVRHGRTLKSFATKKDLVIQFKDCGTSCLTVRAEDPDLAYHAIRAAMHTFY